MKKNPIPLAIAAVLFIGWMIFLGTQAMRKSNPVVVSRAQMLESRYEVEVDLQAEPTGSGPASVEVRKVLYAVEPPDPSGKIEVANLSKTQGYVGPGAYLVPLIHAGDKFAVAGYPLDPGNPVGEPPRPRIYPLTDDVRRQHAQIRSQ